MKSPPPDARDRARHGLGRRMRHSFARNIPERAVLARHPMLRPVAQHLLSPRLWHLQHEAVARGLAIGIFWAFVMPIGQIPLAAAHCVWWRANIPIAVAATFLTNPLTLGFWLWLAWLTGGLFIDAPPLVMPGQGTGLLAWLQDVGKPVVLGMGLFAFGGGLASYVAVKLGWRAAVALRRRQRLHAARRQSRHD